MVFALFNMMPKLWRSVISYQTLKDEHQEVLEQRLRMEEEVKHLQNARGVEEMVRNRFNVGKEGEEIFVVIEEEEFRLKPDDSSLFDKAIKHMGVLMFWQ